MSRIESAAAAKVGARIRGFRTNRLRITQSELTERSGIETAHIRRYELGKALPSFGGLIRIAHALGVDPGELVSGIRPEDLCRQPEARLAELLADPRRSPRP